MGKPYSSMFNVITVTIAASGSLSDVGDLQGYALVGIEMPSAWTAAAITLQGAASAAANVANVYDKAGAEFTLTVAASRFVAILPSDLAGIRYIKARSGTAGTPVAQAAAAAIGLVVRSVD